MKLVKTSKSARYAIVRKQDDGTWASLEQEFKSQREVLAAITTMRALVPGIEFSVQKVAFTRFIVSE